MTRREFLLLSAAGIAALSLPMAALAFQQPDSDPEKIQKVVKTEVQWRKALTANQFAILRQAATERAYSNAFWNNHQKGQYVCAGCGLHVFDSSTKFESGTGWPSFWAPARKAAVIEKRDPDGERVEILCARCDGHLGHVFEDATGEYGIPKTPTGRRFCMNSGAMKFVPAIKKV